MELNEDHLRVLVNAVVIGDWYVDAATLAPIGELIRAGYLTAYDDYEGPRIAPTDKARNAVLARGMVRRTADPLDRSGFTYLTPQPEA